MSGGTRKKRRELITDTDYRALAAIVWLRVSMRLSRVLLEYRATLQFSKQVCSCKIMAHIHKLAYEVEAVA